MDRSQHIYDRVTRNRLLTGNPGVWCDVVPGLIGSGVGKIGMQSWVDVMIDISKNKTVSPWWGAPALKAQMLP